MILLWKRFGLSTERWSVGQSNTLTSMKVSLSGIGEHNAKIPFMKNTVYTGRTMLPLSARAPLAPIRLITLACTASNRAPGSCCKTTVVFRTFGSSSSCNPTRIPHLGSNSRGESGTGQGDSTPPPSEG